MSWTHLVQVIPWIRKSVARQLETYMQKIYWNSIENHSLQLNFENFALLMCINCMTSMDFGVIICHRPSVEINLELNSIGSLLLKKTGISLCVYLAFILQKCCFCCSRQPTGGQTRGCKWGYNVISLAHNIIFKCMHSVVRETVIFSVGNSLSVYMCSVHW